VIRKNWEFWRQHEQENSGLISFLRPRDVSQVFFGYFL